MGMTKLAAAVLSLVAAPALADIQRLSDDNTDVLPSSSSVTSMTLSDTDELPI